MTKGDLFIIGHPGDGQVEIFYVDFGRRKVVPVTDLRRIKDEFFALPIMVSSRVIREWSWLSPASKTFGKGSTVSTSSAVQAIHCCLEEIVPRDGETWDDSCIERFVSLVHQKVVTVVSVRSGGFIPWSLSEINTNKTFFCSLSIVVFHQ